MSKGFGKLQRQILAALERGPLDTHEIAQACSAGRRTTHRSLLKLEAAGRIACVGYAIQWTKPDRATMTKGTTRAKVLRWGLQDGSQGWWRPEPMGSHIDGVLREFYADFEAGRFAEGE